MEFLRNKDTGVVWPKTDLLAEQSHFEPCDPPEDHKPSKAKKVAEVAPAASTEPAPTETAAPPASTEVKSTKATWQDITDKNELDAYAKEVGVELDRRQSLAKMKEKLAAALKKKG